MYLVDTDVISEIRSGEKARVGVREFFEVASRDGVDLYLSVVTVGELRTQTKNTRPDEGELPCRRRTNQWNRVALISSIYSKVRLVDCQDAVARM
jgi:predicted nucleic acid-binding protein